MLLIFSCIAHQVYFLRVQGMLLGTERGYVCPSLPLAAAKPVWVGREPAVWESGLCAFPQSFHNLASVGSLSHNILEVWGCHQFPSVVNKPFGKERRTEGITKDTDGGGHKQLCRHIHMTHPRWKEAEDKIETKGR